MDRKKSSVIRVPDELISRVERFRKDYAKKEGRILKQSDAFRLFSENSLTKYDEIGEAWKKISKFKL